jgi:hypothetical protein
VPALSLCATHSGSGPKRRVSSPQAPTR